MRAPALLLSSILLLLAASAAQAAKVRSWSDPQFDFTQVKTWRWEKPAGPSPEHLDRKIREAVRTELAEKGLAELPAGEGEPDVLLSYNVASADVLVAGLDLELGYYGDVWAVPGSASSVTGGLIVEMTKPDDGKEVWFAVWTKKGNTPQALQKMATNADKAVRAALAEYPPKD